MYIDRVNNNNIAFSGVKISGVISPDNTKKFGDFLSRFENIDFITSLEKNFNTDMVLNSDLSAMSFHHKQFGDLSKFGAESRETQNYLSAASDIFKNIKSAIAKAAKDKKKHANLDNVKRGC